MKLKEYIDILNEFVKENPETLEFDVIYAEDDEGNGFGSISYSPTKGVYQEGEFWSEGNLEDEGFEESDINAVCIN